MGRMSEMAVEIAEMEVQQDDSDYQYQQWLLEQQYYEQLKQEDNGKQNTGN